MSFLSRIKFAWQQQMIGNTDEIAPAVDCTMQENPKRTIREEYSIVWNECNIYGKIYILIHFE